MRDNVAAGNLDVGGLQPGSTLTMKSEKLGFDLDYHVNATGSIEGKAGVINSTGTPADLTVTATTGSNESLVGTFQV